MPGRMFKPPKAPEERCGLLMFLIILTYFFYALAWIAFVTGVVFVVIQLCFTFGNTTGTFLCGSWLYTTIPFMVWAGGEILGLVSATGVGTVSLKMDLEELEDLDDNDDDEDEIELF